MSRRSFFIQLICIVCSALTLVDSRALFAPYLLAALFAFYCLCKNRTADVPEDAKALRIIGIASAVSSLMLTLANYGLWLHPHMPDIRSALFVRICKLLLLLILLSGFYFSTKNILTHIVFCKDSFVPKGRIPQEARAHLFFTVPFAALAVIYIVIWALCYYPGLLSLDSLDQIRQMFSGEYSNHQPFYHTMLMSLFIRPAYALTGNINTAVAVYSVFQILFMAATFSFVIYNMARLKLPVWCEVLAGICYALLPYHFMFSFTLWKDVYFGAFVTLLIVFFIRIAKGIGNSQPNHIGFAVCGPVICLIRSNGLFTYIFVFVFILLLLREQKKMLIIMLATICVSFVCKHTVLNMLGVTPPDTVESLSIPLQQVARVVADGGNITAEDTALLSDILDVEEVKEKYDPDISDPVKNMIRDFGNEQYLSDNMGAFAGLYLRTLIHNPMKYIEAYVDSTCGYWNSGYNYWVWFWDVESNEMGIERTVFSESMLHAMDEYLWLFYNNRILQVFIAVGLFVWILLMILARDIARSDRIGIITTIPILSILLSLLISSPVYSEFRYMYALFCALPIIAAVALTPEVAGKTEETQ